MTPVQTNERLLDGACFKAALLGARNLLHAHIDEINRLNVFPVPDGDTGTNMYLTLDAVVNGLENVDESLPAVLKSVSHHALLGARGNSGVILAQFLVGFTAAAGNRKVIDGAALAHGFAQGTQEAYRIVSRPQEGTILTVMRAAAEEAAQRVGDDLGTVFTHVLDRAHTVLAETPNMLPILKKAGVIDAGGLGFVYVLEAFTRVLHGEAVPAVVHVSGEEAYAAPDLEKVKAAGPPLHRYCTEFSLAGAGISSRELRTQLNKNVDSLLVLGEDKLVHVHLHTDDPGEALQTAAAYGRVFRVKIDDMYRQVDVFLSGSESNEVAVRTGVVAAAPGDGVGEIMRSLGASEVVMGTPSVGELLTAVARVNTAGVIILPNDENVRLVADQASNLATRPVQVVNTLTVPQGLTALLVFDPHVELAENVHRMESARTRVHSGSVARSVRSSTLDEVMVHTGEFVGIYEGKIVAAEKDEIQVLRDLVGKMLADNGELVTLFYGATVAEKQAEHARTAIANAYPQVEVQFYYGGQPDRDYIVAVE